MCVSTFGSVCVCFGMFWYLLIHPYYYTVKPWLKYTNISGGCNELNTPPHVHDVCNYTTKKIRLDKIIAWSIESNNYKNSLVGYTMRTVLIVTLLCSPFFSKHVVHDSVLYIKMECNLITLSQLLQINFFRGWPS